MATAEAKLKNLPVSARKARLVADMIRGKNVIEARNILTFTVKACALPMRKLLDSAVANAESFATEHHERVDTDAMVVSKIIVNEGRTLKRFQPAPRGRATRIRKRSSHVELVITEK
jgi:large subunit ribosomal protein L22